MKNQISNFLLIIFFGLLVFTRSFAGIYFFEYRIGEYLVAIGLLLTIFIFINYKKNYEFNKVSLNIFRTIFVAFLLSSFVTGSDLLWTYTFRVTSFIWTASYVFVGYYLFKDFLNKKNSLILFFGVLIIYIFGTGNYPDFLINIFKQIADKFTFVKASDMVLAIVITNLISLNVLEKNNSYIYFLVTVTSFFPLIVQMSRGAAVSLFLFAFLYICFNFKFIFFKWKNLLITVLGIPLIFTLSTYRITQFDLSSVPLEQLDQVLVDSFDDEVGKIKRLTRQGEEVDPFLSFYLEEREHITGKHLKLISTDGTFNWRLDMWQELYYFQDYENKLLFGYGTTNKLPVFLLEYDTDVEDNFKVGEFVPKVERLNVGVCGLSQMPTHSGLLENSHFTTKLKSYLVETKNTNIKANNKNWLTTNNMMFKTDFFVRYLQDDFTTKFIDYVKEDVMAGHYLERFLSIYCFLNSVRFDVIDQPGLVHRGLDSHETQNIYHSHRGYEQFKAANKISD